MFRDIDWITDSIKEHHCCQELISCNTSTKFMFVFTVASLSLVNTYWIFKYFKNRRSLTSTSFQTNNIRICTCPTESELDILEKLSSIEMFSVTGKKNVTYDSDDDGEGIPESFGKTQVEPELIEDDEGSSTSISDLNVATTSSKKDSSSKGKSTVHQNKSHSKDFENKMMTMMTQIIHRLNHMDSKLNDLSNDMALLKRVLPNHTTRPVSTSVNRATELLKSSNYI